MSARRADWRKRRQQEHLPKRNCYYIFCEGEKTEPQYFSGFKQLIEENPAYKNMVQVEIEPCGAETMRVLDQAVRYAEKNHLTLMDRSGAFTTKIVFLLQILTMWATEQTSSVTGHLSCSSAQRGVMSASNFGLFYILHITPPTTTVLRISRF